MKIALIILDEAGQELCKMTLSPLKNDNYRGNIRWIVKIEMRKDNTIISRSNVGHRGSIINDLSKKYEPEDTYFEDPEPKEIY